MVNWTLVVKQLWIWMKDRLILFTDLNASNSAVQTLPAYCKGHRGWKQNKSSFPLNNTENTVIEAKQQTGKHNTINRIRPNEQAPNIYGNKLRFSHKIPNNFVTNSFKWALWHSPFQEMTPQLHFGEMCFCSKALSPELSQNSPDRLVTVTDEQLSN